MPFTATNQNQTKIETREKHQQNWKKALSGGGDNQIPETKKIKFSELR